MPVGILVTISIVFFILPHIAIAQAGDPNRVVCPDVPRLQKFNVGSTDEASKKGMEVVNGNQCLKCSDHTILVEKYAWSGTVTIETTRRCKTQADLDTYGCKKYCPGCTKEPSVSLRLTADGKTESISSKSKCDERIGSAINTAANTNSLSSLAALRPPAEISRTPSTGQSLSTGQVISKAFSEQASPEAVRQAANNPGLRTAVVLGEPGAIARAAKAAGLSEVEAQKLAADRATLTAVRPQGILDGGNVESGEYYSTYQPQPQRVASFGNQSASPFGMFSSLFSSGSLTSAFSSLFRPTEQPIQSVSQSESATKPLANAVAQLIIQPEQAARGTPLNASWTSLGTKDGAPCALTLRDSAGKEISIGSAKEGTVRISTKELSLGYVDVTLICPSPTGEPLTREKRARLL